MTEEILSKGRHHLTVRDHWTWTGSGTGQGDREVEVTVMGTWGCEHAGLCMRRDDTGAGVLWEKMINLLQDDLPSKQFTKKDYKTGRISSDAVHVLGQESQDSFTDREYINDYGTRDRTPICTVRVQDCMLICIRFKGRITQLEIWLFDHQPTSWMCNFVDFSGQNLENSQTWGFRIETFVTITSKNSASDKDYEKRQNQVTKYKCFQWQKVIWLWNFGKGERSWFHAVFLPLSGPPSLQNKKLEQCTADLSRY
jgi:hypothetical protein